jgi:polyphenol oxidase
MDAKHYLQSELLTRAGFVHAFFTRRGGISEGAFQSLNLSPDVGDRADHVQENLRRAARALGLAPERLIVPRQVHGNGVLVLDAGHSPGGLAAVTADAIVSGEPRLGCAVRTADCVPILLADGESGRVAAIHAGWRGVVSHVVSAALQRMLALGSRPEALLGVIGPHISARAFEVGEDVAAQLASASSAAQVVRSAQGQKPRVELATIVSSQLVDAGLDPTHIERVPGCTHGDASWFFSHRRDGQASGRMLSAIVPRAQPPRSGGPAAKRHT